MNLASVAPSFFLLVTIGCGDSTTVAPGNNDSARAPENNTLPPVTPAPSNPPAATPKTEPAATNTSKPPLPELPQLTNVQPPAPVTPPTPPAPVTSAPVAAVPASPTPTPVTNTPTPPAPVPVPKGPEPKYPTLAAPELIKLAEAGDPKACWILGLRHETGDGVATNAVTAYQWVAMAVERAQGMHRGLIEKDRDRLATLLTPVQIEQARKPAVEFSLNQTTNMIAAAEKGTAAAQFVLGFRLLSSGGSSTERKQAVEWLAKAADQKHVGAASLLGRMYLNGDSAAGVTKDLVKGCQLLGLAAAQGSSLAQAEILQASKDMSPAQLAEASPAAAALMAHKVELLRKNATLGDGTAKFRLGLMFYLGTEIPKDLSAAAEWFQKAGEVGHPEAPALLAGMHFTGEGLKQSYLEAYKWHGIAQGRGNAAAAANKTEAGKLLTTEEKAAADKAVTAWLAAHPKK